MLYRILWWLVRPILFLLGLRSEGATNNIPAKGPLIVVANHVSAWDPIMVAAVFKRQIHFMAKAELFNYKILGKLIKSLNAFPVKRGAADRKAIRESISILEQGLILGMFPEGSRNKTNKEVKAQLGVAMIALKTGAPVIPVACIGTDSAFPIGWFRPLKVKVGQPIKLEEFKDKRVNSAIMAEVSDIIDKEINALLEEEAGI
ncbi:MAG TPA: lysophospholipid acyltransferase family protein [Syntrophomonadaceae bacterium]|nr:lysophospholipid acyltransferase family protein [Syntrophomonadaceae bacterium]